MRQNSTLRIITSIIRSRGVLALVLGLEGVGLGGGLAPIEVITDPFFTHQHLSELLDHVNANGRIKPGKKAIRIGFITDQLPSLVSDRSAVRTTVILEQPRNNPWEMRVVARQGAGVTLQSWLGLNYATEFGEIKIRSMGITAPTSKTKLVGASLERVVAGSAVVRSLPAAVGVRCSVFRYMVNQTLREAFLFFMRRAR